MIESTQAVNTTNLSDLLLQLAERMTEANAALGKLTEMERLDAMEAIHRTVMDKRWFNDAGAWASLAGGGLQLACAAAGVAAPGQIGQFLDGFSRATPLLTQTITGYTGGKQMPLQSEESLGYSKNQTLNARQRDALEKGTRAMEKVQQIIQSHGRAMSAAAGRG